MSVHPLDGLRVVDFGQYLAGPLSAMILADNGADVVRIDPPGGPRWNHPVNATLQRGKRSIVLDLKSYVDLEHAQELVSRADVVIEGFRPGVMDRLGLGADGMTAANPRLVYCSLPGFGREDPRAGLAGWEGIVSAAAGHYSPGHVSARVKADTSTHTFSALPLTSTMAGIVATNSILTALIERERSGLGQTIEVPLYNAMFHAIAISGMKTAITETADWRLPTSLFEAQCADGRWVSLAFTAHRHYRWFAERFFPQEWLDEGFGDPEPFHQDEALGQEALRRILELFKTKPADEWDQLINEAGSPAAACQETKDWLHDEHARTIRAVIELDDPELGTTTQAGYPVTLSRTPPATRGPRNPLDADREEILAELESPASEAPAPPGRETLRYALEGFRVLDLTTVLAGPTAGRVLTEFGADVTMVVQPDYMIISYVHANNGKRTTLLNLAKPEGKEVLWPLIERSDVLIQNMSRGTAERLGIGEQDVRNHRDDIVYASISTYNYDGPRGGGRGYEPAGQARVGISLRRGGDSPMTYRFALCDVGSGEFTAMGILLALLHRERTGEGQHVQSSLVQAGTYHQLPFMLDYEGRGPWDEPRGTGATGWGPLDRLYQTSDGWLYVAAVAESDAARLEQVTGANPDVESELERVFQSDTAAAWAQKLQAAGIAAHESLAIDDVMEDERAKTQQLSIVRDHPGIGAVRLPGPAPRLSRTPMRITFPASLPPGRFTREVVAEAGFETEYAELLEKRVVAESFPEEVPIIL